MNKSPKGILFITKIIFKFESLCFQIILDSHSLNDLYIYWKFSIVFGIFMKIFITSLTMIFGTESQMRLVFTSAFVRKIIFVCKRLHQLSNYLSTSYIFGLYS